MVYSMNIYLSHMNLSKQQVSIISDNLFIFVIVHKNKKNNSLYLIYVHVTWISQHIMSLSLFYHFIASAVFIFCIS